MKKATFPGIVCTSIGYEYQLFSDEKYLYIVRLCREGRNDFSNVIGGPEEFKPILGNVRVNKMEAESVRCKSVRGKMSIVLNLDNESLRFVAKNRLNEDDLLEVFSEMPLRMTVSQKKALPVQIEMLEIGLFIASMALALPGILVKDLPGMAVIAQWVPVLWMLIPLVSVAVEGHKHHSSKARKPFSISVGVMAGLFSCLFMWPHACRTAGKLAVGAAARDGICRGGADCVHGREPKAGLAGVAAGCGGRPGILCAGSHAVSE